MQTRPVLAGSYAVGQIVTNARAHLAVSTLGSWQCWQTTRVLA